MVRANKEEAYLVSELSGRLEEVFSALREIEDAADAGVMEASGEALEKLMDIRCVCGKLIRVACAEGFDC